MTLEYCISAAAIARPWGKYFTEFWQLWGLDPPNWLDNQKFGSATLSPSAAAIVLICMVGATRIDSANWTSDEGYFPHGYTKVFVAFGKLFFSYLGFDMVSSLAEETRNPQRNIPLGIIRSLTISGSMYIAISIVATGMVSHVSIAASEAPLVTAMVQTGVGWAGKVISHGALFGLTPPHSPASWHCPECSTQWPEM